jgi:RNA polymerase subunit RPABC4/transcription elongation factor Spt4
MKIKTCVHQTKLAISEGAEWCSGCGSLFMAGEWRKPIVITDPRRWVVLEPAELPPHAERRAWEGFAAANMPFAAHLVLTEKPGPNADLDGLANALAARMADRMMGEEWASRFGGASEDDGDPTDGG